MALKHEIEITQLKARCDGLFEALKSARAEGERAGLERAAKCADEVAGQQVSYGEVSEKYGDEYSTALHEYAGDSARDLATAIRALKVEGE